MPDDPVGTQPRLQFSLRSLFVMMAVVALLLTLLFPALNKAREEARRAQCVNNLRQWGIALGCYHTAYESFPYMRCGTGAWTPKGADPNTPTILPNSNSDQLSGFVPLLPYIVSNPIYLQIANGTGSPQTQSWGPPPDPNVKQVWGPFAHQNTILLCPSDETAQGILADVRKNWGTLRPPPNRYGCNNYVFCLGDSISNNDWVIPNPVSGDSDFHPPRGMFGWHTATRIADILDGLSNTIALSERVIAVDPQSVWGGIVPEKVDENYVPSTCLAYAGRDGKLTTPGVALSGRCWVNGHACFVGFTTCLPPNSPSCGLTTQPAGYFKGGSGGIYSASSYHPGGVNAAMADGSVRFIANSIDTGDLRLSEAMPYAGSPGRAATAVTPDQPSRWGVWGALGSKASGEQLSP